MSASSATPVRFGILGAARIAPTALLAPARLLDEAEVVAVAARDRGRAELFAKEHGIPQVAGSYGELIACADVDAVYIPLMPSAHREWTLEALRAGKPALVEKPFTLDAEQAEEIARVSEETGVLVAEAFHLHYHPLLARVKEIIDSGVLGRVERVDTTFGGPRPRPSFEAYWDLALGGGATMHLGCYQISSLRFVLGGQPQVIAARAGQAGPPGVDSEMTIELGFPGGVTGHVFCIMGDDEPLRNDLVVRGSVAEMRVENFIAPDHASLGPGRITLVSGARRSTETVSAEPTYNYQLRAFCRAVREGSELPTGPSNFVANMRVIDAVYKAAGLPPRGR